MTQLEKIELELIKYVVSNLHKDYTDGNIFKLHFQQAFYRDLIRAMETEKVVVSIEHLFSIISDKYTEQEFLDWKNTLDKTPEISEVAFQQHMSIIFEETQRIHLKVLLSSIHHCIEEKVDLAEIKNLLLPVVDEIFEDFPQKKTFALKSLCEEYIKHLRDSEQQTEYKGINSGYTVLDRFIGGFLPGRIYTIGARPGMGKTTFIYNLIINICLEKKFPCLFFSHYTKEITAMRFAGITSGIHLSRLYKNDLTPDESQLIIEKSSAFSDSPLFINDSTRKIEDLKASIRHHVLHQGIRMVFIGNLQGISSPRRGNIEANLDHVMKELQNLAKELRISIVVTSMISRNVELRGGLKKPHLADLKYSGSLEEYSDVVMFLWAPSYYGFIEDESGNVFSPDWMEISVAKNNYSFPDVCPVSFNRNTGKIRDFDRQNVFESPFQ